MTDLRNDTVAAALPNSELTPKELAFREQWEFSRAAGKARFVLFRYVLGRGLFIALVATVYGISSHSPGGWWVIFPNLALFTSVAFVGGLCDWALNERKYREQSERTGILMKPMSDGSRC